MRKSTGESFRIVLIGAGRLATQIAKAFYANGQNIVCVYSRTSLSALNLANKVEAKHTNNINDLQALQADLWIYALKDDTIEHIATQIPNNGALHVHTSGSVSIDIFEGKQSSYGSIYPLQTFNIDRDVDFSDIPIFYENNNITSEQLTQVFCNTISPKIYKLSSEKRKHLHLSAVFACNFTNALWAATERLLEDQQIPKDVIYPLIAETLSKAQSIGAQAAQTGPALRGDINTIRNHVNMLEEDHPLLQAIYFNITKLISLQNEKTQ